ncbi:MAG: hypothetical protein ACM3UY_07480 [Methanocella sp.]
MEPSEILASKCRQKILRVLAHVEVIRLMKLVHKTGCRYNEIMRNLLILEREGIIVYTRLGRQCIVGLNRESPKTRILIKAIRILDMPIDYRQPSQENDDTRLEKGHQFFYLYIVPHRNAEVTQVKASFKKCFAVLKVKSDFKMIPLILEKV